MRTLATVKADLERQIKEHEDEATKLRAELDRLENKDVQAGFALAVTYAQPQTPKSGGDTGEKEVCPYDASHGTFKRVNRHIAEKHKGKAYVK